MKLTTGHSRIIDTEREHQCILILNSEHKFDEAYDSQMAFPVVKKHNVRLKTSLESGTFLRLKGNQGA